MTARLIALGSVMLLALTGCSATTAPARPVSLVPGDHFRHLKVDGQDRSYLVHVPPAYDPKRPTPVVLIYHGALANASLMTVFCGMNKKADASGFVAVYPNGTGFGTIRSFNAGCATRGHPADDVKFTAGILDDLATVVNVDTKRVYATGMSNGGMMVYRLAAELSDRIAAIAAVSGTLCIDQPHPKRPVPVIHFHGAADTIVPFGGPNGRTPKFLKFQSVDSTVGMWAKLDGCPEEPNITRLADTAKDGTTVTRRVYGPGKEGAEVVLYVIDGGGHTWPGQEPMVGFIGKSTKNISANDLIWEFFENHPMRAEAPPPTSP